MSGRPEGLWVFATPTSTNDDVDQPAKESRHNTVVGGHPIGDAKKQYGNANDCMKMFEANKREAEQSGQALSGSVLAAESCLLQCRVGASRPRLSAATTV
jgi:hypothetical protein